MEFLEKYFLEYIDNRELHENYYLIMEEYAHTDIFKIIVSVLDNHYKNWKTNRGLGDSSAEFVLLGIDLCDYITVADQEGNLLKSAYDEVYEIISVLYQKFYSSYQSSFKCNFIDKFSAYIEINFAEKELTTEQYEQLYNEQFELAQNLIPYDFVSDIVA